MSYDVNHFELPGGASRFDRYTLAIWKLWSGWLRPTLVVMLVMGAVAATLGTVIAGRGGFVALWSPTNYAAAVTPGESLAEANRSAWTQGIIAQAVASVVAAIAIWPIVRRARRPIATAFFAGALVTVAHITVSHQWTVTPIVGASSLMNGIAIVTLWVLPFLAGLTGFLAAKRR